MRQFGRAQIRCLSENLPLFAQAVVRRFDRRKVRAMTVDGHAHAELGQTLVVAQRRVAVGDQHQRHGQVFSDLFQLIEVLNANHADAVGARRLVLLGAADDFLVGQDAGVGARDDRHFRVDPGFQCRANLADAFGDGDQVGGFAAELRGQQGVFNGQGGDAGAFQFNDRAHHVEGVAVAVVGVGDYRQLRNAADTGGLLGELAEGDQGKVRGTEHLQRGHGTTENPHFKTQVSGDAGRHRVEHRCCVVASVGGQQLTEVTAQILMRKPGHTSSTNTKEWKGLSKCVNAEGLKGYHANGSRIMTNLRGQGWRRSVC